MDNYLNTIAEKIAFAKDSGIDLNNMESFINKCFVSIQNNYDTKQNIDNGYPIICAILRGIGNGHCLAIIGYTSDDRIVLIEPEQTEKRIESVSNHSDASIPLPWGNSVITLHEIMGHGRQLSLGIVNNNDDTIRFENLLLRVMGYADIQRDGTDHADSHKIKNPSNNPSFK